MSQSNVEKVRNLVIEDPELQKRLEAAQGERALVQALIGIGTEKGLTFTEAELDEWKSGEGTSIQLTEKQLHSVAAGGMKGQPAKESYGTSYGNSIWCGFCGSDSGTFMT